MIPSLIVFEGIPAVFRCKALNRRDRGVYESTCPNLCESGTSQMDA